MKLYGKNGAMHLLLLLADAVLNGITKILIALQGISSTRAVKCMLPSVLGW